MKFLRQYDSVESAMTSLYSVNYNTISKIGNTILTKEKEPEASPIDEIWYTTSAGTTVNLTVTSGFGANVVSNTYENGKGIIKFDGTVTAIPNRAFQRKGLTSVQMPDTVTSIGDYTFAQNRIESINMPKSLTTVNGGAFFGCYIKTIIFPEAVSAATNGMLQSCPYLTTIVFLGNVTSFRNSAFAGCTKLKTVILGQGSTNDQEDTDVFFGDTSLTDIYLPDGITKITGWFSNCSNLKNVHLPNNLTIIADTFKNCTSLESIVIPSSVEFIAGEAFYNCTSLMSITCLGTNPPNFQYGSDQFANVPENCNIYVPASAVDTYKSWGLWANRAAYIQAIPE